MPIKRITRYKTETVQSRGPESSVSRSCDKKPSICVNRGDYIGKANCGCSGAPRIWQCNAIPDQLCTNSTINQTSFPIISDGGKTLYESITTSEVVRCSPSTCTKYMEDLGNGSEGNQSTTDTFYQ